MENQTPLLEARGLHKSFGENSVLSGVDLAVPKGSVTCVIGKSGTGKSVFLKCLAGIIKPDSGEILFEGEPLRMNDREAMAEFRSRCSYLFQGNALLDSLSVIENVSLPLEQTTKMKRPEFTKRARDVLEQLELDDARHQFPSRLSGGMQKRVALARAIVTRPRIVLFDEPTAGLDPVRRNAVFVMIARYQRAFGFTAVVVTHDLDEALVSADNVAMLDDGSIHFQGTATEFGQCEDASVRSFRDSLDELTAEISNVRNSKQQRDAAMT